VLYNLHIPAAELEDNAEFACGRTHEEATKEALHVRNNVSGCMSTLPSLLIITAAVLSVFKLL